MMTKKTPERTPAGNALSDTLLDILRLSNSLLIAGDRLVAELGLTSARWQVLGTIFATERPQPVAWIARDMGAHRQNVQRIINDLESRNLVAFLPNPHHRRAQLVALTEKGMKVYDEAMRLQTPWINALSRDLKLGDIETTRKVVSVLKQQLDQSTP